MSAPLRDLFLELKDEQLDAAMFPLIRKWDDPPTALQLLEVLDHCIHGALASSFIVTTLQVLYDGALKREGTTHDEMAKLATWRTP